MSRYTPEIIPAGPVQAELLQRELRRISAALASVNDLPKTAEPDKPREGMLRWFDASVYDPGLGTGLYVYTSGAWRQVNTTVVP